MQQTVKAISMMQPYAELFVRGLLKVDDRGWSTRHRGELAVHASKKFDLAYYRFVVDRLGWQLPEPRLFDQGGVVGLVDLIDCLPPAQDTDAWQPNPERAHFGAPGYFGLVFANPRRVAFHACRGSLGLFDVRLPR